MIGFTLLLAYISLTGYNLLWLVHPKVGKLERILSGCRKRSKNALDSPSKSNDGIPEIRLEMYYDKKGKDFSLLMQLLAEQSSGLSQAFRILCVFDKHFQRLWKPRDNKVVVQRPLINTFTLDPQDKGKRARIIAIFNAGVLERQVFSFYRRQVKYQGSNSQIGDCALERRGDFPLHSYQNQGSFGIHRGNQPRY